MSVHLIKAENYVDFYECLFYGLLLGIQPKLAPISKEFAE